jgi:hypothetical protein
MGFIPEDARWYIADLLEEITISGESKNVLHRNSILIRADSPEEAYEKAGNFGRNSETSYLNSKNQNVSIKFRGIAELDVIRDQLEDGAELMYTERIGVAEDEITKLIPRKEQLGIFRPIKPSPAPDYGSKEVRQAALEMMRKKPN